MNRIFTLLLFVFISFVARAQTIEKSAPSIDSLKELDMILNLLDSTNNPKSYFDVSLGIGNRSFSVNNNSVNASQSQVNKLYYTPAISYHHKSGFGISVTPFFTTDNGKLKAYQTAITPSFDYESDKISTGISFSKFLADTKSYNSNSTYQNDLFAYFQYTKSYIQPIISLGYSTGKFKEITQGDSVTIVLPNRNVRIARFDSTNNEVKDFSASFGIEHTYTFDKVFSSKGSLSFTPQFVLNATREKFNSTITNIRIVNAARRTNRLKALTQDLNSSFRFQSVALSLSTDYYIGNFVISPNFYIDYYLPPTTEKRLSNVFSVSVGYTFY